MTELTTVALGDRDPTEEPPSLSLVNIREKRWQQTHKHGNAGEEGSFQVRSRATLGGDPMANAVSRDVKSHHIQTCRFPPGSPRGAERTSLPTVANHGPIRVDDVKWRDPPRCSPLHSPQLLASSLQLRATRHSKHPIQKRSPIRLMPLLGTRGLCEVSASSMAAYGTRGGLFTNPHSFFCARLMAPGIEITLRGPRELGFRPWAPSL